MILLTSKERLDLLRLARDITSGQPRTGEIVRIAAEMSEWVGTPGWGDTTQRLTALREVAVGGTSVVSDVGPFLKEAKVVLHFLASGHYSPHPR